MVKDKRIFISDDLINAKLEMKMKIRAKAQEEKAKETEVNIGCKKLTVEIE